MKFSYFLVAVLTGSAAAAPTFNSRSSLSISSDAIAEISPNSASCANAPKAGECRTSQQAAAAITKALACWKVSTPGEAAAVISTMAFESGDFKYQRNYYPGRPGQGTRNMQMVNYNLKYAQSIPALRGNVSQIVGSAGASADASSLPAQSQNAIRDLLLTSDVWDFGSAVWYLTTVCTPQVRQALQAGTAAGFSQYVTSCIGTTMTDERQAYWTRAVAALK